LKTHFHFIVWACERVDISTGNFIDNASIDLIASDSDEALTRAKKLVRKNVYAIHSVIEHFGEECAPPH